jgi:undecaprenyl-diphosphatase
MNLFQAIILGIIEGITEFLPVSSTGHMIIGTAILGIKPDDFVKVFTVCIQFGAILSVVVLYWKRFFKSLDFYVKLFVAFIPAGVFGLIFNKLIDRMLGSVEVVAISLLVGGIILVFIDNLFKDNEKEEKLVSGSNLDSYLIEGKQAVEKEVTLPMALKIGFFQVISMIPGVSRSAATIVGGLTQKLSRKQAAEFSFFLAVPTMFAATAFKLLKTYHDIDSSKISLLVVGNIVAFIVAMIAIKSFITFLTKHGLKVFGWYRIIVGATLLILILIMHVSISVV